MRVLVTGGRDYRDREAVARELDALRDACPIDTMVVIQGGATGADQLAREWCGERGVQCENYAARWSDMDVTPCIPRKRRDGSLYNAAAGAIRNQRMLDEGKPDLVIGFPGKAGTADMVRRARRAGVRVLEVS